MAAAGGTEAPVGANSAAEEARTRRALLHMLEDLQREQRVTREARRQWIDTVDAIGEPVMVHDGEGRIVRANKAYAVLAGIGYPEFIGRKYWECFPRRGGPMRGCLGAACAADGGHGEEFADPGGKTYTTRSFLLGASQAGSALVLHLFQDVTRERREQQALRSVTQRAFAQSEALSAIVSSAALFAGDLDVLAREITEHVAAACEVARVNVWLFSEDESELTCIDHFDTTTRAHASGMVLKQSQFKNEFNALKHAPFVAADDPLTDPRTAGYVDSYLRPNRITSMLDAVVEISGRHLGLLCLEHVDRAHHWESDEISFARQVAEKIAIAISNRRARQAEAAMRESEQNFRALFEHAPVGISEQDASGRYLRVNRRLCEITGYSAEEFRTRSFREMTHPADLDESLKHLNLMLAGEIPAYAADKRYLRKDGKVVWAALRVTPLHGAKGVPIRFMTIVEDITERKVAEVRLLKLNRALKTLSAGNETLVRAPDEAALLEQMIRVLSEVGGYAVAWVGYALRDAERIVEPKACIGMDSAALAATRLTWADTALGQEVVGTAIRSGEHQIIREVGCDPRFAPWRQLVAPGKVRTVLGLPLRFREGEAPFGAIGIGSADADSFDVDELRLLEELAGDLAYGIANLRMAEANRAGAAQLRRSLESTVGAIAATMETRDPYTAGHQRRVADLAAAIAREMGLPADTVEGIHFGALLHDIGKIQVPAEILSKPTRLSMLEFEIIKTHPQAGYEIVKDIEFPWPVAAMVHQHHERLDGTGYPQGLKGDQIAFEARILAVADVVEAMSSHRPYRAGLGIEAALKEIEAKRGLWLEPAAVDACLRLFREKGFSLAKPLSPV